MLIPTDIIESIKALFNTTLSKLGIKDSSPETAPEAVWDKWGLNVVLVDNVLSTPDKVYKKIVNGLTDNDIAESLVFTDQKLSYSTLETKPKHIANFDSELLDTWVLGRQSNPVGSAFVLIDTMNGAVSENAAFNNLVEKMDSINTAVYLVVPLERALNSVLSQANKVYILPKQRKVTVVERIRLYNLLIKEVNNTTKYSQFNAEWHDNVRANKSMVVENGSFFFD